MNDERFHSGLNIAGYCITMAGEDLLTVARQSESLAVAQRLMQIREDLNNCAMVIDALKLYLATHPTPALDTAPLRHCLWP